MATTQTLIACHECDLLHRIKDQSLHRKSKARCVRCGAMLYACFPRSINRTFALAITGLILLLIANTYPFLSLVSQGNTLETALITGTIILSKQHMPGLALLVLLTSILFPGLFLGSLIYVLCPIQVGGRLPASRHVFRFALSLRQWSMPEIFFLGILVSVVKLAKMATIVPGPALFSFLVLVFVVAAVNVSLDPFTIWMKMEKAR